MTMPVDFPQPAVNTLPTLDRAIVETLAYFDVFDYPLISEEIHRYLHGLSASYESVVLALRSPALRQWIDGRDGYFFLAGRGANVALREQRRTRYSRISRRVADYGRLLGRLPFMRMVALTGSSAMQNGDDSADLDFMLVTAADRLWLARAFAILLGRFTALNGHILCPNVILSENVLVWPHQDLYSAHELTQMIPLAGMQTYNRFRQANGWALRFLPNASTPPAGNAVRHDSVRPQRILERALAGDLGQRLEAWEMRRKITRLTSQTTPEAETAFTSEVCQGNFNQHGRATRQAFLDRIAALGLVSPTSSPAREMMSLTSSILD